MEPEPFDWNEMGEMVERHEVLLAAKEALAPELLRELEDYWNTAAPGQAFDPRRAVVMLLQIAKDRGPEDLRPWRGEGVKPMPELIDDRRKRGEKLNEVMKQAETYWNGSAPCSEPFKAEKGIGLLLYDAKRFAAGLASVVRKADDQKALMDHKTTTGQEVTDADRQRWFAYLEAAHIALKALSHEPPSETSAAKQS